MAKKSAKASKKKPAPKSSSAAPTAERVLAIEYVDPHSLVPADYNPRIMDDDARAKLHRGLNEFGYVEPLVVRREDRLVVGGHQRLDYALSEGHASVPVVFIDDLDDDRAKALNILLNNPNAQGRWDFEKLVPLIRGFQESGFDATLPGFDANELTSLAGFEMPTSMSVQFDAHEGGALTIKVEVGNLPAASDIILGLKGFLLAHPEWKSFVRE